MNSDLDILELKRHQENLLFNYCLMDNRDFIIRNILDSTGIEIPFDLNSYYLIITGLHRKYKARRKAESYGPDVRASYSTSDHLLELMNELSCRAMVFGLEVDNSRQYGIFFTPSETSPSPEIIAKLIGEKYIQVSHSDRRALSATSLSSQYKGLLGLHQAYEEARYLNNLSYFRQDIPVFTSTSVIPHPCNLASMQKGLDRLRSVLNSGTLQDVLGLTYQIFDVMIYESLNYADLNYAARYCDNLLRQYNNVYHFEIEPPQPEQFTDLQEYHRALDQSLKSLFERLKKTPHFSKDVLTVLSIIYEDYARNLTLHGLAEELGISESRLSVAFNKETGHSVPEKLNEVRIAHAKELLETTALSVAEISDTVGFSAPKYFTAVFNKTCGCSPSAWRRQCISETRPS